VGSHSFVFLDLSSYLICDRRDPGSLGWIQVCTEDRGKLLRCDEDFIEVLNETNLYSARLKLDADRG
jgi:hypothetical protein